MHTCKLEVYVGAALPPLTESDRRAELEVYVAEFAFGKVLQQDFQEGLCCQNSDWTLKRPREGRLWDTAWHCACTVMCQLALPCSAARPAAALEQACSAQ